MLSQNDLYAAWKWNTYGELVIVTSHINSMRWRLRLRCEHLRDNCSSIRRMQSIIREQSRLEGAGSLAYAIVGRIEAALPNRTVHSFRRAP